MAFANLALQGLFLGFGSYGQKLFNYFEASAKIEWLAILVKNDRKSKPFVTNLNDEALVADFVVIALPDHLHNLYLDKLAAVGYPGAVFCEKSPVVKKNDLGSLQNYSKLNIYYNLPLRFSSLDLKFFSQTNKKLNIIWGHNFAFKEKYRNNWRASLENYPNGIGTSLAIHFVYWAIMHFGTPHRVWTKYVKLSEFGTSPDTLFCKLIFNNAFQVEMLISYCMSPTEVVWINEEEEDLFELLGQDEKPKIVFGKPLTFKKSYINIFTEDFDDLNRASVKFFLSQLQMNKRFELDSALMETLKVLLIK